MQPDPQSPSTSSEPQAAPPAPPPPLADANAEGFKNFEEVQQELDPAAPEFKADDATAAKPALPTYGPEQIYTAKEVLSGATALTMLALRGSGRQIGTKEVGLFKAALEWTAPGVIRTEAVLEQMEIGQALAQVGFIKGTIPGLGETAQVDPRIRLAAGALVLGFAVYGGIQALGAGQSQG